MGNLFHTISLVLLIISAAGVILLVLLQHGKGADMGAAFGSGSSGSLFGASGSANFLSRMTSVFATVFFLSTTALAFIAHPGDHGQRSGAGSSVMEGVDVPAPASSSVPAAPGESPAGAPAQPDNAVPQAPGQSGGAASQAPGQPDGAVPQAPAQPDDAVPDAPAGSASAVPADASAPADAAAPAGKAGGEAGGSADGKKSSNGK